MTYQSPAAELSVPVGFSQPIIANDPVRRYVSRRINAGLHNRGQYVAALCVEGGGGNYDDDESPSTASSSTLFPEAPDGGYGWIVVIASFLIHFIADGISFSFGIMYPQIQNKFGSSKAASAIAGSLYLAMPLLAGPFASVLTDRYDCRTMTIVGGFLAAFGFFVSTFAQKLWILFISFGIIAGLGLSFCFNTAIIAVTYYFEKKRALATSIAVCGSGMGTFVFAPLIEHMQLTYGWRGSLLILSAILLNLIVCGALIRDLEWPEDTLEYKRQRFIRTMKRDSNRDSVRTSPKDSRSHQCGVFDGLFSKYSQSLPDQLLTYGRFSDHDALKTNETAVRSKSMATFLRFRPIKTHLLKKEMYSDLSHLDLHGLPTSKVRNMSRGRRSTEALSECGFLDGTAHQDAHFTASSSCAESVYSLSKSGNWEKCVQCDERPTCSTTATTKNVAISEENSLLDENRTGENCLDNRSVSNREGRGWGRRGWNERRMQSLRTPGNRLATRIPSAPVLFYRRRRRSNAIQCQKLLKHFKEALVEDCQLLKSFSFSLFLVSTFLLYIFYDIPYVNLPEYAVAHLTISERQSSFFVSVIGIVNTVGMIFFGLIADWPVTSKHKLPWYGASTFISGLCVLTIPWINHFWLLLIVSGVFGFFISSNYTLTSVIVVELLSLSEFANGYGLVCLIEGLGTLIGPTLAGFLHDFTGSYLMTFIVGGIGIMISGILVFIIEIYRCACKNSNGRTIR